MMPYLFIFDKPIPMYGICAAVGLLFGGLLVFLTSRKRRDYSKIYIINIPLICAVGAFIGAHFVYALTMLDTLFKAFQEPDVYFRSFNSVLSVLGTVFGGMVFYGGLLGAILAAFIYCKAAKVDFDLYADIFAPAIPLFHAFGRIGCTFAGCCFGMEADWGIPVMHSLSDGTVEWHNHVPIPLIEAGCNLLIMVLLLILRNKHLKKGSLLAIYFMVYPIVRFIDEFFRGDEIRGIYFGLSTSQWISIVVFIIGGLMLLRRYVFRSKERFGYKVPTGEIPEGYDYNKYAGAISPHEQEKLRRKKEKYAAAAVSAAQDDESKTEDGK